MRDVVVGIDRSESAKRAAVQAAQLAAAYGVNLHIVTCVERGGTVNVGVGADRFHADWLSEAEHHAQDVARSLAVDDVTIAVILGDPADVLCAEAQRLGARAIVVGNRRVQSASRILGSVASAVMRNAPCDVLVANTTDV